MRAETLLAELDRLRKDLPKDPEDLEWLALHHAFCFISYQMTQFRKYVDEAKARGEFKEFDEANPE